MRRLLLTLLLLTTRPALAHDFWIEPSTFHPAVGETVSASLRVGQQFIGEPITRSSQLIERFVVRDAAGERTVTGAEAMDPAGDFKPKARGPVIVGYWSRPSPIWLPADRYEAYLRLEGLDGIVALRAKQGLVSTPGRERFSRFAKALLYAGPPVSKDRFDQPLGFPFEIIPELNPYTTTKDTIPFRVSYQSKPLQGVQVVALCQDDPALTMRQRSDAGGHVSFRLPRNGVWLVKAVHMVPSPPGANADWDSFWASVTFDWKRSSIAAAR